MGHLANLVSWLSTWTVFLVSFLFFVFFLSVKNGPSLSPLLNTYILCLQTCWVLVFRIGQGYFILPASAMQGFCTIDVCSGAYVFMYVCAVPLCIAVLRSAFGPLLEYIHTYIHTAYSLASYTQAICSTSSCSRLPSYFPLPMSLDVGEIGLSWSGTK